MRPAWFSANHPLVQREVRQWRKQLRQLWFTFLILPCACTLCLGSPSLLFSPGPRAFQQDLAQGAFLAAWGWEILLSVWLTVVTTTRAIALVARERETSNWPLLRLTPFDPVDIVKAKTGALIYGLRWPIALVLGLRLASVVVTVFGAVQTQQLTLVETGLASLFLFIFCAELLVNVGYNCAVGLLASTLTRTTAAANALVYPLHFALFLFIFLPLWYLFGGEIFGYSFKDSLSGGLTLFNSLIIAQVIVGALLFRVAAAQAQRLTD